MDQNTDYINKLDAIADTYHHADIPDKFIEELCQDYTLNWLFEKLGNSAKILELGYGDGIISHALAAKQLPFEIVEGSPRVIEGAQKALPEVQITQSLFETFKPAKVYDCILALHVLEHVDEPVELLQTMSSWLEPGGTIVIIVPNKNSLHRRLAVHMSLQSELDSLSPRDLMVGHQRVYSLQTLGADVEAAGFSVVETAGFFLKALPNSMMLEYDLKLIQAMNDISPDLPPDLLANIGMVIRHR